MSYPEDLRQLVDDHLETIHFSRGAGPDGADTTGLDEAMRYSLLAGGKRIRPVLCLATAKAIGRDPEEFLVAAGALEMVHTYSLVHDDLPAMDDDAMRRGRPSCHAKFGEATAILVGDALQARAFELIADAPNLSEKQKIRIIKVLAEAAGARGMVGGQFIDITATGTDLSLDQLQAMHTLKTGALIRAALIIGGVAASATEEQLSALDRYGCHIGLAFQVVDDILDVEGDTQTLGKTRGKDGEASKPTYVKLMGLDGAKAEARRLLAAALQALDGFGDSANPLRDLACFIVERDR